MKRALVFTGGELGDVVAGDLPRADLVVAADSGFDHAQRLGVPVDLLIGDMDSITSTVTSDVPVVRYPVDKDATDTELAIDYAITEGATDVVVVGGVGGRLDHWLGIIFGLCREQWADTNISATMGRSRVYVVRHSIALAGEPGQVISQFAVNGNITKLTVEGLKWAGEYETVEFGSSLCLSDVFVGHHCRLSIESGTMLVVHELGVR